MNTTNSNAIFKSENISIINRSDISILEEKAKESDLQRFRYCLHEDHSSLIQEMVIAFTSKSYCRPHKHPNNITESYHIYSGELLVLFFNEEGEIIQKVYLNKETPILRMNSSVYHMPIALTEVAVYHETITGPFHKDRNVEYAQWAPCETDKDSRTFLEEVKKNER